MVQFTASEYADMIITYGIVGENARAAERLYAERFPRRRRPSWSTILQCVQRLRETGSVLPNHLRPGRGLYRRVRDEEEVLREFERNPGNSIRRVAGALLGVSRSTIHRVLKENGLHPYHYQRVQQLLPGDAQQRVFFCEAISIVLNIFSIFTCIYMYLYYNNYL